jgi:RNA polymerase sigma-70 factor (ECF subfamily)
MEISDESLVMQVQALRDVEAFTTLVRRYQSRVRAFQRRLCRADPALAEDLSQETFWRAWDKIGSYKGKGKFSAWLMTIAYNEFRQAYRKSKKVDLLFLEDTDQEQLNDPKTMEDPGTLDLPKLMAVLNDEEQQTLVLSYAHGFSNTEIAGILGLPAGTVKSQIHRAKNKIRDQFALETLS